MVESVEVFRLTLKLKSDYFRIEIKAGELVNINVINAKIRLF
ncbi:hypothetical protein DSM1535_0089 [Methanobacterium formicicum]|uniref:Uncharacterized protein n=1 Tax=Methanobacterium formicicum TaxID=2162 RepID=A0A090I417_METFO|nr:hypothetical protein DSM1535_0089 [Methanobacterium formicicum]